MAIFPLKTANKALLSSPKVTSIIDCFVPSDEALASFLFIQSSELDQKNMLRVLYLTAFQYLFEFMQKGTYIIVVDRGEESNCRTVC